MIVRGMEAPSDRCSPPDQGTYGPQEPGMLQDKEDAQPATNTMVRIHGGIPMARGIQARKLEGKPDSLTRRSGDLPREGMED